MRMVRLACWCLLAVTATTSVSFACEWVYPIWMLRSRQADRLYRFVQNDLAGYIDRSGAVVIPPQFEASSTSGGEFHDGRLKIGLTGGRYVDVRGRPAFERQLEAGRTFSEGLAVAMPAGGATWGYIDPRGEFVISPRFAAYPDGEVDGFSDGFAKIRVGSVEGYIDRTGEFAIAPRFLHGRPFSDGMAAVVVDGPCWFVGDDPCPDIRILPRDFRGDADRLQGCLYTYVDSSGRVIGPATYEAVKDFSEGTAAVRVGSLWGYIDKRGTMVVAPRFEAAEPFADGMALVKVGGRYGYIRPGGTFVIEPRFEYAESFSEGFAVVGETNRGAFWFIDRAGTAVFTAQRYALASAFVGDLAHVRPLDRPDTLEYIDKSGEVVFAYRP